MTRTDVALARLRRDLTLSGALKVLLIGGAVAILLFGGRFAGGVVDPPVVLLGLGILWAVLSYRSIKNSRLAAASPSLIAAGQLEAAEHQIDRALRGFSLFRPLKLMSLHHLALLRHAQQRFGEAATLWRELLKQPPRALGGLSRPARLMLADTLLKLGDLPGCHQALLGLYQQRLSLGEAMHLLLLQLDYSSRIGAWESMRAGLEQKVQLAELMPAPQAAQTQAFLALAALQTGEPQWAQWLRRRVELLSDAPPGKGETAPGGALWGLLESRPVLRSLWDAARGVQE